jgi:hypothetical protein
MFLSYVLKGRSEKAQILNLEVSSYALSFAMQNRVGQNFLYDALCSIYTITYFVGSNKILLYIFLVPLCSTILGHRLKQVNKRNVGYPRCI